MASKVIVRLVGAHPPAIGGVAIHIQRLAELLGEKTNTIVTVEDLYSAQGADFADLTYLVNGRRTLRGRVGLLLSLCAKGRSVIHWHLSAGDNRVAIVILLILASRNVQLVTLHSGSFNRKFLEMSPLVRRLFLLALRRVQKIICVSTEAKEALENSDCGLSSKLCVIPAYLPLNRSRRRVRTGGRNYIVASGYATRIYEWLTLLKAYELLENKPELHLVFYNTIDEPYYEAIQRQMRATKGKVVEHINMEQGEFAELLSCSHVFVRPTTTDGDSVAVREALSLGVRVVASDCVERPDGCLLFTTGDAQALAARVQDALDLPRAPAVHNAESPLLEIYDTILS